MNTNTAVGEIRTYYLNLPEDDLTEGGRFTAEVLEKLVATERAKVLSEVDKLHLCHTCGCDKLLSAKLNQLKGTEWVGVFAPNGGHDPNNPYPLKRKE